MIDMNNEMNNGMNNGMNREMNRENPRDSLSVPLQYVCARDNRDGAARNDTGGGTAHVLHVDGDADSAIMLATLLVPETRVTHVQTLAAAADAVARERYALLVLDPDLPDGDGAALFEALRVSGAPTPVLLYSARHTVWRDQASAFLLKPWTSPRQLWNTVERLLHGSPAMWVERG